MTNVILSLVIINAVGSGLGAMHFRTTTGGCIGTKDVGLARDESVFLCGAVAGAGGRGGSSSDNSNKDDARAASSKDATKNNNKGF